MLNGTGEISQGKSAQDMYFLCLSLCPCYAILYTHTTLKYGKITVLRAIFRIGHKHTTVGFIPKMAENVSGSQLECSM